MRIAGAKKQTFLLTGVNAIVRALGLGLRVWTSRLLGAETMGIIELSQSVHMIAIAPLTSGVPAAMTRLSAKNDQPEEVLISGLQLVKRISMILVPLFFVCSPAISALLGEKMKHKLGAIYCCCITKVDVYCNISPVITADDCCTGAKVREASLALDGKIGEYQLALLNGVG